MTNNIPHWEEILLQHADVWAKVSGWQRSAVTRPQSDEYSGTGLRTGSFVRLPNKGVDRVFIIREILFTKEYSVCDVSLPGGYDRTYRVGLYGVYEATIENVGIIALATAKALEAKYAKK